MHSFSGTLTHSLTHSLLTSAQRRKKKDRARDRERERQKTRACKFPKGLGVCCFALIYHAHMHTEIEEIERTRDFT